MSMRVQQVLACAALVALAALTTPTHAQERCDSALIGNATEYAYNLEEQRVEPDLFTLEISEPDICSDSEPLGMRVTACDVEQAPRIYLMDTTHGLVVREGKLDSAAHVYITVFCASDVDEDSDDSSEYASSSNQLSDQTLSSSSTLPSTSSLSSPFANGSIPMSPNPQSFSLPLLPNTLQLSGLDSLSSSKDILPSLNMESRFSQVDQFKGPPSIPSIPSRLKEPAYPQVNTLDLSSLWKKHTMQTPFNTSPTTLDKISSKLPEKETMLDKAKQLSDSYSSFVKRLSIYTPNPQDQSVPSLKKRPPSPWSDTSLPSLAKRLPGSQSEQQAPWFPNRAPSWLKRPTRRPSSPWLKHRSLSEWPTRKSMSQYMKRLSVRSFDDNEHYDDEPLSLHWSEERIDPYPWWIEGQSAVQPAAAKSVQWRSKHSQPHWNESPAQATPLIPERPSPHSIKHLTKKRQKLVPPIYEEDPALLAEWNDPTSPLHWPKRPLLPKLLLLLQEQDPASRVKCAEDDPWWPNQQEHAEDGVPWEPDYPIDYSADDGDPWGPYFNGQSQLKLSHPEESPPSMPEWPEHPPKPSAPVPSFVTEHPWCSQCPPVSTLEARKPSRQYIAPSRHNTEPLMIPRPPVDYNAPNSDTYAYYTPPLTERPLLSSTVRHSVSWHKSSKSATPPKKSTSSTGEHSDPHAASAAGHPWSFLSKLLLSHPSFRDSTHVIRI